MEYYDLCLKVIERELKKFNLNAIVHSKFESGLTALIPDNFDVPYNRCAFMSCYATSNIITFKDCINNFLLNYPKAQDLLCEWKSHSEVKVCSLSTGPGLDYLAFALAILGYDPLPPQLNGAKIISKYTSWQNTIDLISEVFQEQGSVCGIPLAKLNFDNVKVIQTDDLVKCFSKMYKQGPLRDAHIVLMMKTLSLSASGLPQEMSVLQMLKELLSSLRSDATIFCLDTIPSITLFIRALSCFPGQLLYGPTQQTSTIPPSIHLESDQSYPLVRASSTFFVWRKLPFSFGSDLFSFEGAPVSTDCKNNRLVTAGGGDKHFFLASDSLVDKMAEKVTFSEILPWRELPPGKLSWGAIFWENASAISRKSLTSLMTLKKENVERHWIREVARLYLKEYGTQNFSNSSSENIISKKNSGKSNIKAKQAVVEATEILFNTQTMEASQNVSCLKDIIDINTENAFTHKFLSGSVNEGKAPVETVATDGVETNPETLTTFLSMNIQDKVIDTNTEDTVKKSEENTVEENISNEIFVDTAAEIKTTENVHSTPKILDNSNENSLLEKNCCNNASITPYFLNSMNNFNCKSIQDNLTIHNTDVFVHDSKKEIPLPISFLAENITCKKSNVKTQIDPITKELNKTTKLAAVLNNNIKEGSQDKILEIDVQESLKKKINPTVTRISDVSEPPSLESHSKVKKQKEQLKYSEILPWRELPPGKIPWGAIFWQNASVTTKKSLKNVLSFKKDILDGHWIGEVARLYVKEYGMQNMPASLPKEVRNKDTTNEKALESINVVTKASDILSIPKTMLTPISVHILGNKLNTNTENSLFEKDNCCDITPNSFHTKASNFNCKSMQCDKKSGDVFQSVKTKNILLPLQFKEKLAEIQVEHNTIQNKINKDTKPAVTVNDNTDKSFKCKLSQTIVIPDINQTKNNLADIEALAESVRQLVSSFDKLTKQNVPNTMNETSYHTRQKSALHNNHTSAKEDSLSSGPSIAKHSSASRYTSSFQNEDIHMKCPHRRNSIHSRVQCCRNRPNNIMHCHTHDCNASRCQFSRCRQLTCPESNSYMNSTSQNLVIPLRNISDDALLRIVSILKSG